MLGSELRRCDDVFWKGRPSQCRSFWLHGFEIEGDYEFEGQHTRLLGNVVHQCHTGMEASLEDTQASERLYQLGASKTIPGTLGLWALVVDAAPYDVRAVTEGLLATMIQEEDIEMEEGCI